MKKLLGILVLGLFLSGSVYSKNTKLVKGNFFEGKIKWQSLIYQLPEGEWNFFYKSNFSVSSIRINCIEFIQTENKVWKGFYDVCEINNGGKHAMLLGTWLAHNLKKGKYDNCTLRPEYFYAKLWTSGMSMNCFKIRHFDIDKELNYPDDPEAESTFHIKKYFKDNNIKIPKTAISSLHLFYSPNVRDIGIEIVHSINPELYGAPETINGSEIKSEYHRDNIENYPIKKNFMIDWTANKAKFHKEFEEYMKAKPYQRLDLIEFLKLETNISNDKNLTKQLKSLNDLYKAGVLTEEEFTKAKKKIID